MEYKVTNTFMIFLLIIIISLGGMYAYKIINENDYKEAVNNEIPKDPLSYGNTTDKSSNIEGNKNTNQVNEGTSNTTTPEVVIPQISVPSMTSVPQSTAKPPQTVSSTYSYNNRYYYNQLDNYAKIIYDSIANNIGNLKTGVYVINISSDFTPLLNQPNGQEQLDKFYGDAINAINLDIPDLFYIDFSKMYLNIESTTSLFGTSYRLYIDCGNNFNYLTSEFGSDAQVSQAIASIDKVKNEVCQIAGGSEFDKIKVVHDWLIENMSYNGSSDNKGTIYGAFIEKRAVCEGYSRAFKYILDNLGITNVLITGTGTNSNGKTEDHMWNYINLNGTWYGVDVTWDDPVVYGGGTVSSGTKHKYFLIGSDELFKNHIEKRTISSSGKLFTLPTISKSNYKYY